MSVIQLGKRGSSASESGRQWEEARLRAKITAVTLASEALVEALEASLVAADLIRRLSEQPTPACRHPIDIVHGRLQNLSGALGSLLGGLKSL